MKIERVSRMVGKHTDLEVERGSRVQDNVDARGLHDFVKSALLGDVRDNGCLQLILAEVGVGIMDFFCLVLRAHRGDNRVASREQRLQDMCWLITSVSLGFSSLTHSSQPRAGL